MLLAARVIVATVVCLSIPIIAFADEPIDPSTPQYTPISVNGSTVIQVTVEPTAIAYPAYKIDIDTRPDESIRFTGDRFIYVPPLTQTVQSQLFHPGTYLYAPASNGGQAGKLVRPVTGAIPITPSGACETVTTIPTKILPATVQPILGVTESAPANSTGRPPPDSTPEPLVAQTATDVLTLVPANTPMPFARAGQPDAQEAHLTSTPIPPAVDENQTTAALTPNSTSAQVASVPKTSSSMLSMHASTSPPSSSSAIVVTRDGSNPSVSSTATKAPADVLKPNPTVAVVRSSENEETIEFSGTMEVNVVSAVSSATMTPQDCGEEENAADPRFYRGSYRYNDTLRTLVPIEEYSVFGVKVATADEACERNQAAATQRPEDNAVASDTVSFPRHGLAMYYNPGIMAQVLEFRQNSNHVTDCTECIGYVALLNRVDLDLRVWIEWANGDIEGPFLVIDTAAKHHIPLLIDRNWVIDVDYKTALRRGMNSPLPVTVWDRAPQIVRQSSRN